MNKSEMDAMTLMELSRYRQEVKNKLGDLGRKIQKRREYLKSARYPLYNAEINADEEIVQLKAEYEEAQKEMSAFKEYMKIRKSRASAEEAKAKLELQRVQLETMMFEAEHKDFIGERNRKADDRRPHGPNVWFGSEFNNIRGAEKRLIVMMAREIGQARYSELKRIAYWDENHGNNRYYTGDNRFDGRKGLF